LSPDGNGDDEQSVKSDTEEKVEIDMEKPPSPMTLRAI
jgi:hypothetical protein